MYYIITKYSVCSLIKKKKICSQVWQMQTNLCEFKATLFYIARSRTARAIEKEPISKPNQTKYP